MTTSKHSNLKALSPTTLNIFNMILSFTKTSVYVGAVAFMVILVGLICYFIYLHFFQYKSIHKDWNTYKCNPLVTIVSHWYVDDTSKLTDECFAQYKSKLKYWLHSPIKWIVLQMVTLITFIHSLFEPYNSKSSPKPLPELKLKRVVP